jgi:hypothetical protein
VNEFKDSMNLKEAGLKKWKFDYETLQEQILESEQRHKKELCAMQKERNESMASLEENVKAALALKDGSIKTLMQHNEELLIKVTHLEDLVEKQRLEFLQ